jgi:hypothetical protein
VCMRACMCACVRVLGVGWGGVGWGGVGWGGVGWGGVGWGGVGWGGVASAGVLKVVPRTGMGAVPWHASQLQIQHR